MIRSFIISFGAHLMIVVSFLVLGLVAPPVKPIQMNINIIDLGGGGGGGEGGMPGEPPASAPTPEATPAPTAEAPAATPAPTPEPIFTPEMVTTPQPAPTPEPEPEPEPVATPEAKEDKEIIIPAKETPEPTPIVPKKLTRPDRIKKEVVTKKPKIIERDPALATPTPAPAPKAPPKTTPAIPPPSVPVPPSAPPKLTGVVPPIRTPGSAAPAPRAAGPRLNYGNTAIEEVTGGGGPGSGGGPGGPGGGSGSPTYFGLVLQRIKSNFSVPFNRSVICKVRFTILRDGTLTNSTIVQSTGDPTLDSYAISALKKTGRVQPFYDDDRDPSRDVIVTFTFEKE